MTGALLSVQNLSKAFRSHWTYTKRVVLSGVSFEVHPGDIFGFIGQNGAGKTTTIKCVLGLIRSDSGEILFNGQSACSSSVRKELGYLPELPYFYDHLSVEETLQYLGGLALRGASSLEMRRRIAETIELVGLADRKTTRVKTLSKGLQQRLGLAQAIINTPKLLLLDEPFSGLDPVGRAHFRSIIQQLNSNGTTVLISSHVLSDVQSLCNRVAILGKGQVQRVFSLEERGALFGEKIVLQVVTPSGSKIPVALSSVSRHISTNSTQLGEEIEVLFASETEARQGLEMALNLQRSGALKIREFRSEARSLEEIFLQLADTEGRKL